MFMTHRASCLCLPPLIGVAILLAACQGPGLPPAPPPDLVSDDPAGEQPHMTPETPGGQPEATPGTLAGGMPTLTTFVDHEGWWLRGPPHPAPHVRVVVAIFAIPSYGSTSGTVTLASGTRYER